MPRLSPLPRNLGRASALALGLLVAHACSSAPSAGPDAASPLPADASAAADAAAADDDAAADAGATDTMPAPDAMPVGLDAEAGQDHGGAPPDAGVGLDARPPLDATAAPDTGPGDASTGPQEDCTRYPYSRAVLMTELVGFAQGTTGGSRNNLYRVTSRSNTGPGTLRDALESTDSRYIVFDVEGEFRVSTRIRVRSNKTLDGRGRDVRIVGDETLFDLREGTENVIFTDLDLSLNRPADNSGDVISVRGHGGATPADFDTRRLWFHHLALHYGGDGLIDLRGATEVTISWSHMYYHTKAFLHLDDVDENLVPGMHVTYHHNFFDTLSRRGPHFAAGKADFFNNYQYHWYEYGAAAIDGAQFLSEANIYEARPGRVCIPSCPDPSPHGGGNDFLVSKIALSVDWAQRTGNGYTRSVGDLLENDAEVTVNQPNQVFQRSTYYQATPEVADQALKQRIRDGAGPRTRYCR